MNNCEESVMDDEERLEAEEDMELDDGSEGEDEDDAEDNSIPISPSNSDQLLGPSTQQISANSHCLSFAESLSNNARDTYSEEIFQDTFRYQKFTLPAGKPLHIRRGPGRPRKDRLPGAPRSSGIRSRGLTRGTTRVKGIGYGRGVPRRTKSKDEDTQSESPSPLRVGDDISIDGDNSSLERSMPAPEEPPLFPEQWPGKVCALCNLGERSQLGQGELLRLVIPDDFRPEKNTANREETPDNLVDVPVSGDKSPRAHGLGAVTCRRQKSLAKCRNPSLSNFTEPIDELTVVGYAEEPEISILFDSGFCYVHKNCAVWSSNSQELLTDLVCSAIVQASARRCAYCSHYGAALPCKVKSCNRYFHFSCAAASSCFQDIKTFSLFCSQHLGQVPLMLNGDIECVKCYGMGDVSNLVMCCTCNQHFHGSCVGVSLIPSTRAGWQCLTCRSCQVCRQPEELSKVMSCEKCDKIYHPTCLRPIVTSIPKYGWKCKNCRICTDCGSRTPGAGLSSRWHSHYTVCDSCYQQRNKGSFCPLCGKAYRAAAFREMVRCSSCSKFVHATCDPGADPLTYQQRKEAKSDYEYVCLLCKNVALVKRKDSMEDYGGDSSLTASQESLYGDGDSSEVDFQGNSEDSSYSIGLGKGKPFCASKIAKKRLGLNGGSAIGRPKGTGKLGYQKRQKMTEFGRKRGPKAKMRGIFGVPGVGLQRPTPDSFSKEEEPGIENRLVLCSSKDKFVLSQDICVMCGAIGTDQEGCLIACAQCGQCYHPYCANVKVTKVILQKGWRCLDCTVCEGCGERNDEGRLILCDDCDISYHIYCMDPPLDNVPQGTWKCKWCAQCQSCGSNDPGFNSNWQKSYTQCGPCASHLACAACNEPYIEGDLIIQCVQCERWLHCLCDSIKTEADAEKCAEEGYDCILCRPRDVPPPHILCNLPKPQLITKYNPRVLSPPPITRSPELYKPIAQQFLVDGVYLSETGMHHIKSLVSETQITRKKRRKLAAVMDKDADIMATIESVVAGGSLDNSLEDGKLDLMDMKEAEFKEGMVWTDQPPPDGFSIYTTENGITVLRRKRQRNLQKLGIGGFIVRIRGTRKDKDDEGELDKPLEAVPGVLTNDDKPRRKPQRRKPKTKLSECFPLYMQEAFFGRELMDTTKEKDLDSSSDSDSEKNTSGNADTIQLSQDELRAIERLKAKNDSLKDNNEKIVNNISSHIKQEEIVKEEGSDTEALSDILPISSDLLDNDLVNTIMNEQDDDITKTTESLEEIEEGSVTNKDELTDILSPNFSLDSMVRDTGLPNMDGKDVEEIFKGVLTDESQESQESSAYPAVQQVQPTSTLVTSVVTPHVSAAIPAPAIPMQQPTNIPAVRPQVPTNLPSVVQPNLSSPMSFPPPSPYHSEYSNSPQFSPAFSEPPSPWINADDESTAPPTGPAITYNQRSNMKMEADEALGTAATISSVLYANINHPEWKTEYPVWSERCKQILKKWRALPNDKKAPFLTQARDNRAAIRMKKTQQEQEKINNRERSTREAEQERQWKQLQALRQQQAQMQQQVIHDQRIHVLPRVNRQLSDDNALGINNESSSAIQTQSPISVTQEGSQLVTLASPSSATSCGQFATPSVKVNRGIAPQSPHQGMTRLPSGQTISSAARSVGGVVRPGIANNFIQPPSPFSPQPPQSPQNFPQSPASGTQQAPTQSDHFQRFESAEPFNNQVSSSQASRSQMSTTPTSYSTSPRNDVYSQQTPGTPRPIFNSPAPRTTPHVYAPSRTPENVYVTQPNTATPVLNYVSARSESRSDVSTNEVFNQQQPEVNRQLRDLLQRQQFNKDVKPLGNLWSQETQNTQNATEPQQQNYETNQMQISQQQQPVQQSQNSSAEGTFRQPLPPGSIRPRLPLQANVLIRNQIGLIARQSLGASVDSARIQGLDVRARMLLQRPPVSVAVAQQFHSNQIVQQRMQGPRSQITEQYEVLQRFADPNQTQTLAQRIIRTSHGNVIQGIRAINASNTVRQSIVSASINEPTVTPVSETTSEIPDNVTAELEKLEQEGAPMVEVENVSAILGDLGDDDDELLAEMGADFNILEYADPELDTLTAGGKTNILDLDLEQVEVEAKDEKQKKDNKDEESNAKIVDNNSGTTPVECNENSANTAQQVVTTSSALAPISTVNQLIQAPQLQQQQQPQQQQTAPMLSQAQHQRAALVQQQMNLHLQREAAMGRPVPPGTRLLSDDGAVGVVTLNNTATVSYPPTFPGQQQTRIAFAGQQRMAVRSSSTQNVANVAGRVVSVGHVVGPRMPLAPPPPPPPYPGPPPPYPEPVQEQPLLLEELLEQEKREQEKNQIQQQQADTTASTNALLGEVEYERLNTDVLGNNPVSLDSQGISTVNVSMQNVRNMVRPSSGGAGTNWQQAAMDTNKIMVQTVRQPITTQSLEPKVATFNIPLLPALPAPPENIVTEQDRQVQFQYEQWLNHQNQILAQQLKFYQTEIEKTRKIKKSLNSKQRQCRKSGNELNDADHAELRKVTAEQSILQKHLDSTRKLIKAHNNINTDYQNKQMQKRAQSQANETCSPLMSPSQHSSPMNSPATVMSQSPGGSVPPNMIQHSPVASMIQNSPNPPLLQHSPGNSQQNSGTMSPHAANMQSPRINTPLSQGDESPFSPSTMPSPGVCGPSRMTSPQHRAMSAQRMTTSPSSFNSDGQQIRMAQQLLNDPNARMHILQQRFIRPGTISETIQQRPRGQINQTTVVYNQRSPLGSPQPNQQQQTILTAQQHQQMIQQRQQLMQQQQHDINVVPQENQNLINQRNLQIVQRHLLQQQQQQQQQQIMQKPPTSPMMSRPVSSPSPQLHQQIQQQNFSQPPSSPLARSPMVQQTIGSPMLQQQLNQSSQPSSPMNTRLQNQPPSSPMVSQYQPPSPMSRNHPSTSPMLHQMGSTTPHHPPPCQTPNSPMPRSPMVGGSPMQSQRRPSTGNSPAMPDRPQSVENPGTPRTPLMVHTPHSTYSSQNSNSSHSFNEQQQHTTNQTMQQVQQNQQLQQQLHLQQQMQQQEQSSMSMEQQVMNRVGGGNPHNPSNPIPLPVLFGKYGYFKLGLRGGSPMWSASKAESSKGKSSERAIDEKPNTSSMHRKTGISQSKINSLVCADYNDFDADSDSRTPPQTPPIDSKNLATVNNKINLDSPCDKVESLPDTTDYDDDKTIINTEVTLSSTAQRDNDDITVIEQFGESDLDVVSGSLEMQEEYLLFESDFLSVDSNDSLGNALVHDNNEGHDLVQILEIEHPEPPNEDNILSNEDLLRHGHTSRNKKPLHLDIVKAMPIGKRIVTVTETPESPNEDNDVNAQSSPTVYVDHSSNQHLMVSLEDSEIVILDEPMNKSPDNSNQSKHLSDDESNSNVITVIETKLTEKQGSTDTETKQSSPEVVEIVSKEIKQDKKAVPSGSLQHNKSKFVKKIPLPNVSSQLVVATSKTSKPVSIVSKTANTDSVCINKTTSASNIIRELLISTTSGINKTTVSQKTSVANIVVNSKSSTIFSQPALKPAMEKNKSTAISLSSCNSNVVTVADSHLLNTDFSKILQSKLKETSSVDKIKNAPSSQTVLIVHPVSLTSKVNVSDFTRNDSGKLAVKSLDLDNNSISKGKSEKLLGTFKIEPVQDSKIEKSNFIEVGVNSNSPAYCQNATSKINEQKVEVINATDELESMLEAIHNPDDEHIINGEKDFTSDKSEENTLKRMSPVTDNLSLVNILENDVDTVTQSSDNSNKEDRRDKQKLEIVDNKQNGQQLVESSEEKQIDTDNIELSSPSLNEKEHEKHFSQASVSNIPVKDVSMEESSDELLDMLQNIISSKPEMQEPGKSEKRSLSYQLEAPKETLPLNIMQDSNLPESEEQQATASVSSLSSIDNKFSANIKGAQSSNNKKTQQSMPQTTVTLVVTTVTNFQGTTTTVPHLSPLSQPTEIKSNTDSASDQLRTLLSSLNSNFSQSTSSPSSVSQSLTNLILQTTPTNILTSSINNQKDISCALSSAKTSSTASDQLPRVNIGGMQAQPAIALNQEQSGLQRTVSSTSTISITSNAMLNAMLSNTISVKSSLADSLRATTILTPATTNLINTIMSQQPMQRCSNVQTVLQQFAAGSPARVLVNVTSAQQQSSLSSVMHSSRTVIPPVVTTISNSGTTSILQSTLSQAPTLLHSQLTSGQLQFKSNVTLPIDNKDSAEAKSLNVKKENEKVPKTEPESRLIASLHRMEDSQNVLLKQLLQNTSVCTTTAGPVKTSTTSTTSFPDVPSLEAQLEKPVPPTPSSLISPLLNEISAAKPTPKQVLSRETSFLSQTVKSQSPPNKETEAGKQHVPVSAASAVPIQTMQKVTDTIEKELKNKIATINSQGIQLPKPAAISSTSPSNNEKQQALQESSLTHTLSKSIIDTVKNTLMQSQQRLASSTANNVGTLVQGDAIVSTILPTKLNSHFEIQQPQVCSTKQQQQPQQQIDTNTQTFGQQSKPVTPPPSVPQSNIIANQQQQQLQQQANIILTKPLQQNIHLLPQQQPAVVPQLTTTQNTTCQPQQTSLQQSTVAAAPQQQQTLPLMDIKKETVDDVILANNANSNAVHLTDTKELISAKEELVDGSVDDKTDLKKLKRRQYQQKRRQSQGKDANMAPQKKRARKMSRLDEDYDTFIDNLMIQLRQHPPMVVLEPLLGKNYGVCPIFGSGDLSKIGGPVDYNTRTGELIGNYGNSRLNGISDHYNTQPFGELEPLPTLPPVSTQRSFYDQEFPPLKLDDSDDKKEILGRDIDTPDTIVSSSSPECVVPDCMHRFSGLKLIEEESDEESEWLRRISPVIPIISPIPIRLKPGHNLKDFARQDKENVGITNRIGKSMPSALTENGNITVTLTLNSQAADDIMGVLKDLANILNITPPTGYQIIERTTTPPSQKLGLYRFKGKDGKEGAPIDIQSILNGAAKFCRHCDVVILNSLIRKKVSELPFLSKDEAESGDELCFCSVACYMQFALMHRAPVNTHDKAAAIVDHLCQKTESKLFDENLRKMNEKRQIMKQSLGYTDHMNLDIDQKIKAEKEEFNLHHIRDNILDKKRVRKHPASDEFSFDSLDAQPPNKLHKGVRYKFWTPGSLHPPTKFRKPTDKEITEMLFRMGVSISIATNTEDSRRCMFCQNQCDGATDGPARLLNFDVDKWVHLNCVLWSENVYETVDGALMNLDLALQSGLATNCIVCKKPGATVKCFKMRCNTHYHLGCAVKDGCIFYKNKTTYCSQHVLKNEKDNELTTLAVYRRVYVNRDENRQVAAVMHHNSDHSHLLRVGSLIFLNVGQLLPHQLQNFHTPNYIYPVGYKIIRFYWSMRRPNKRCRYVCTIHDVSGRPEFRVLIQEPSQEDVELRDASPRAVWNRILEPLAELRKATNSVQLFPRYVTGEDLFGLTEPAVVRVLESLPGVETLTDYKFKYGRNPLLELPLAINPSGCARTEPRLKHLMHWKRPHTQRTASSARATFAPAANIGEVACPYSKQFVHSKSSQYKKMKMEWRNNVYLARSKIQGLGLYAARDLEKHTMVIEYIGEIIRTELAEMREKQYEAKNRGIYMFRLDEERVIDATLCGGLARYINHSCNPNCVTEIVEVERDLRIIIFAKRRISRGEELAYDYKFDIEDDQHKIACACGAPNCRKWMN